MPELPEVEVMCRALDGFVSGATISGLQFSDIWAAQLRRTGSRFVDDARKTSVADGSGGLVGRTLGGVSRHGKFYFIELVDPSDGLAPDGFCCVEGHLRMTGGWWLRPKAAKWPENFPDKYCHLTIDFEDGSQAVYRDVRRFGTLRMLTGEEKFSRISEMGIDPLGSAWSFKRFQQSFEGTRRELKSVLLDQNRIAGLGNIYACEIAHLAGISPQRKIDTLDGTEKRMIFNNITPLLRESIQVGGTRLTTLDDLQYIHEPQLHLDNFEVQLQVYGREGESCIRHGCNGIVERFIQQQRSTYWCPSCQR